VVLREREDVHEGESVLGLVDLHGGDSASHDLTEETVRISRHIYAD